MGTNNCLQLLLVALSTGGYGRSVGTIGLFGGPGNIERFDRCAVSVHRTKRNADIFRADNRAFDPIPSGFRRDVVFLKLSPNSTLNDPFDFRSRDARDGTG